MKSVKVLLFSIVLAFGACKGGETPAKIKGTAGFQLADGSTVSQAASDEYNPNVIRMSDGYLMLVFGSDRACSGCTTGTHNIFISRSTTIYAGGGTLPPFSTPVVFNTALTPLNQSTAIAFAAAESNYGLRIYYNSSSGQIRYADVTATASSFNASNGGSAITNSTWSSATIIGISSNGTQLIAKSSGSVYIFDPFAVNPTLTAMGGASSAVQSVTQVNASYTGLVDSYLTLTDGSFAAATFATAGSALSSLNSALALANISVKTASILQSGTQSGDVLAVSGIEGGSSKQDLFLFTGTTPASTWSALKSKPASTGVPSGGSAGTISTTATRVYGQFGSFTCAVSRNNGACVTGTTSSQNLMTPMQPVIADGGVYIPDQQNNRALYFSGVSTIATRVYCQSGSFTTNTFGGVPSATQCRGNPAYGNVSGIFVDLTGVYVVDIEANRVPFHPGTSNDASAGRIYGQNGSFTTFSVNNPSVSTGGLSFPDHVYTDSSGVYITDASNNRVLHFAGTSTLPDRVYGQNGSFTTTTATAGASGLSGPRGIWGDADGIYVCDLGNNRVLFYPGNSTTATRVYGQLGSFSSTSANNGGVTANSLNQPWSVRPYGGGVYIADSANHRVLYYAGTSTTAAQVWGQFGSFTCAQANNNGSCGAGTATANSLNNPTGMDVDSTGMYISDNVNNRVLFFQRQ